MIAAVHSSGAGAIVLVAFVLAASRWGTWRVFRRVLAVAAVLGVFAIAVVELARGRGLPSSRSGGARALSRPDDDDRAFERWQRDRYREASKRESVEGFGQGFGGKG